MRIGYWIKYFGFVGAFLAMTRSVVRVPVIWLLSRLGVAVKVRPAARGTNGGWFEPTGRRHIQLSRFMEESGIARDARILDAGCGPGWLIQELTGRGYQNVAGCDWKAARPDFGFPYTRVDLNQDGLSAYSDGQYDVVLASEVLEHLENPAHILRELRRVAGPRGHVFITVPNCWNLFQRVVYLLSGNSSRYRSARVSPPFSHISMFTPDIMESLTDRAQLKVVELRGDFVLFWDHFWGSGTDPLFSHSLMYHLVPTDGPIPKVAV
jgi:SAM-dependent methyltransferase